MMEFKLTIDITDKLADAISAIFASIAETRKCHAASVTENVAQIVGKSPSASLSSHKAPPQCAQEAPECTKAPEPVITQAEPENAKIDPPESQESAPVIDEERVADCAGAQFHCPTPEQPTPAVNADAEVAPAPVEPEKPKKKKSAKKVVAEAGSAAAWLSKVAAETPAPVEAPQPESKPQPEPPAVEAPEKPEPAKADAPKAADGDPMGGMTVMEAVQALFDAIQQKGLDMADVNARVRTKANELGLSYSSIACLIKAVGYVNASRIALGE